MNRLDGNLRRVSRHLCITVILVCLIGASHAARPIINNLPTDVYIGDAETDPRIIDYLDVTELSNDAYACSITTLTGTPAAAAGNEFELRKDPVSNIYEVWTTTAGVAAYDAATTSSYTLDIECQNGNGEVSNGINDYITVTVVAGERVTFGTLPDSTNWDASTTGTTVTIHTESVTSVGNHDIQCALENATRTGFFAVRPGTCEVYTTADLIGIDASTPTVNLIISAYDTTDKIKIYDTLTVNLRNQNTIPSTTNMQTPISATKPETEAIGTTLFTVTVSDPDNGQTHTFSRSCVPASGDNLLDINTNGQFEIIDSLNYETTTFYNCSIYVNDGYHTGGPFLYYLTVTDANETPTFDQTTYYATFPEGAALSTSVDPSITCTDQDTGDTKTMGFLTSTYSSYFKIDSSGIVTFAKDYDIDTAGLPTSLSLTLTCVDGSTIDGTKKTGTATLEITVTDENDNAPTFNPSSYTIYVDQFDVPGSTIGTYVPTDPDTGSNGVFTCAASSASSYGTYYNIASDCSIQLASTIDFPYGTTVKYDVDATDQGTPSKTGQGKLDIIYKETATTTVSTTTTTTESYNFWSRGENIAMFVLLLLAGLALLGLLSYCLARMCCGAGMGNMCDCNMRNRRARYPKRRAITPESDRTPPRRRRSYSPPPQPQKITMVQERPAVPTYIKQVPPYYSQGRYPMPGTVMPGQFARSPFVPALR